MKTILTLLCLSVLTTIILIFWLVDVIKDLNFFRKDSAKWYRVACQLQSDEKITQRPLTSIPAEIMQRLDDLERENAQLRADIDTGCRLIDEQTAMIKGQKDTVTRLISENRRFLGFIKRKK